MHDVACTGSESALEFCRHGGWGIYICDHIHYAGAICSKCFLIKFICNVKS